MTDTTETVVETTAPDANALEAPEIQSDADSSPAVVETNESEAPKAKGVQKRLDELTRNWREEQRRNDQLMRMLEQREAPKAAPAADEKPKTLADFGYDEAQFQSYLFGEADKRATAAARRELEQERERETKAQREASFKSRVSEFAKTVSDYEEVVTDPSLPISQAMAEVIKESDDGPALAYHLGKNPEIAARLAQLPPVAAARELGKIEARLAYEREKAKEKPVVSKAPPPPPQIAAGDATPKISSTDPESDRLSDEEWIKAERKRMNRRG